MLPVSTVLAQVKIKLITGFVFGFIKDYTEACGKGERADKQRLSGMDAASQPPRMGSRRLCVQPVLPDRIAKLTDDMTFLHNL